MPEQKSFLRRSVESRLRWGPKPPRGRPLPDSAQGHVERVALLGAIEGQSPEPSLAANRQALVHPVRSPSPAVRRPASCLARPSAAIPCSAAEGSMQDEIQRPEIGNSYRSTGPLHDPRSIAAPARGHFAEQNWIPFRTPGDDADVGDVPLIARSWRAPDATTEPSFDHLHPGLDFGSGDQRRPVGNDLAHRRAAFAITRGSRRPAHTSGINSRVNLSTAARSRPRTPIRNCNSGTSPTGGAAAPWQALTPRNSVLDLVELEPQPLHPPATIRSASRAFSCAPGQV